MKMLTWALIEREHAYPMSVLNTKHGQYQVVHQPDTIPDAKHICRFFPAQLFSNSLLGRFDTFDDAKAAVDTHRAAMVQKYGEE